MVVGQQGRRQLLLGTPGIGKVRQEQIWAEPAHLFAASPLTLWHHVCYNL